MVTRTPLVVAALVLVACTGSSADDDSATVTTTATSVDASVGAAQDPAGTAAPSSTAAADAVTDGAATSVPTTEPAPGVVEYDGSVTAVLGEAQEAQRFAAGVAAWLDAVPGQDGVLRNARGVTLFVPVDDGFDEAAADAAFADPDTAAITIADHLRVGVVADLDELDEPITVASGAVYDVGPGPTVGGRSVVGSIEAANGVIHLLDGPLPGA